MAQPPAREFSRNSYGFIRVPTTIVLAWVDRAAEFPENLGFSRGAGLRAAALLQSAIRFCQVAGTGCEIYFRKFASCCALPHRFFGVLQNGSDIMKRKTDQTVG
jgi:hypothetical protein